MKVWSAETRKCIRSIDDLTAPLRAAGELRDERALLKANAPAVASAAPTTAMCVCWLPGDGYLAVGTKEGELLLVDLGSGLISERIADAHGGECVWGMDLSPDGSSLATGAADKKVKFWRVEEVEETVGADALADGMGDDFESESESDESDDEDDSNSNDSSGEEESGSSGSSGKRHKKNKKGAKKRAKAETSAFEEAPTVPGAAPEVVRRRTRLRHARTLQMGDEVQAVRFSKSRSAARLLVAVATLDFTVRVFFHDSLKFFLQLYGHSLPVHAMDASDDSALMATGGADKTLKIWGLDFGDCHRSLLAHADALTAVAFVPRTHYIFTASRDKTLKYWDADHFEQILTLQVRSI